MQVIMKKGRLKTAKQPVRIALRHTAMLAAAGVVCIYTQEARATSGSMSGFVSCSASIQGNSTVNGDPALVFGSSSQGIDLLSGEQPADVQGTVNFSCTNTHTSTTAKVRLCLNIDGGQGRQNRYNPRQMSLNTSSSATLNYDLLQPDGNRWETPRRSSAYQTGVMYIPAGQTATGNTPILMRLSPGQATAEPSVGSGYYETQFTRGSTSLFWQSVRKDENDPLNCGSTASQQERFPFIVRAYIAPTCHILSTTDINFGTHSANASNLEEFGRLEFQCSNGLSYHIGLEPSNGNTEGSGLMKSATNPTVNTDTVPYQLEQVNPRKPWGNNAVSSSTNNVQVGIANGQRQWYTLRAVVPSADYTPDEYQDKVTVHIKY